MKNHYPAIDVLASISRLMSEIATPDQKKVAGQIRKIMSIYQENQDLISIGAYKAGSNQELDYAINRIDAINKFLQQPVDKRYTMDETITNMLNIVK